MRAMNFYTATGWAGSNYDSKLSTKEISARVRSYAKKHFPEFKFSVRSEWSMYTGSMYIELKSGPCVPFVEGSISAERGCMSTMSTVKGWENELTPEMFRVLDAVTTYASSFRYNDSDGMQDYFDTNFYLSISISREYKVVKPKSKKSIIKPEKVEESKGMEVVDYSEKAIAVFGDTKAIKDQLKGLGGRFNPSLNYNGEKRAGWIFSKKKADEVRNLMVSEKVESVEELPALSEGIYIPELEEETKRPEELGNIHLTEKGNFNGVRYYNIEGAGIITSAKVREDMQSGDIFNVYTDKERRYSVTYDGVSLESSLKNDLPGIIEFNFKIESGTLSASSHYTPLTDGVEFYEKKVKGKRYTVKDTPLTLGYYGILDNLDNSIIGCYPTKEEAEKEAEILNGFTDGNGRLNTVI